MRCTYFIFIETMLRFMITAQVPILLLYPLAGA
jgi:hypothetical protein